MLLLRAEAFAARGNVDEAAAALDQLTAAGVEIARDSHWLVRASVDLRRRDPLQAAQRLTTLSDEIAQDGRQLAITVQVAALLGVAACDLEQYETAAVLFGHADAEQHRLDIVLRPSDRPLAEHAIETCRTALGVDQYEELAARGAASEWHHLPLIELDAT